MKILFWVPYPHEGASNRYRVEQYFPFLKNSRIDYILRPFWSRRAFAVLYKTDHYCKKIFFFIRGTFSRIFDLLRIRHYDIVFIHRESYPLGGGFFETILTLLGNKIIFDFDDAIFLPSTSKPNSFVERFKNPNKFISIIRKSRYVIAGNQHLADFALKYNPRVSVIPTPIDTEKYCAKPVLLKDNNRKFVIGWMGSITTIDFLNITKDVFIQLSIRNRNIQFKIVGGKFFIEGLSNVISKPWVFEEELNDLRSFDIGIMPMPDNEWTKGKCGFKAILYMSMAIPCISSPVGVNKEIITDGINGFLADSEDEWIKKLSLLIKNPELRLKIGLAGRKTVEERYSVKVNAPKFLEMLQNVYEKRDNK